MIVPAAYHGISLLSRKIQHETNSPISHFSLVVLPDSVWDPADGVRVNILYRALDTCPVYEAWGVLNPFSRQPSGVLCRQGIDEGHTPGTKIELFRINVPVHVPEAEIIRDLDRIVADGTGYDYVGLARYKLRINRDNARRMFCSELVHHVLSHRGVYLIQRREPHKTAPGDLYISPRLEPLWTVHTCKRAGRPWNASQGQDGSAPAFSGRGPMHNNAQALPGVFGVSACPRGGAGSLDGVETLSGGKFTANGSNRDRTGSAGPVQRGAMHNGNPIKESAK